MNLYLHDPGYRKEIINGVETEYRFKNVFICDEDDPDFQVDVRVWKDTEERDMKRAMAMANGKVTEGSPQRAPKENTTTFEEWGLNTNT